MNPFLMHALSAGMLLIVVLGASLGYGALVLRWLSLPQISRPESMLFALGLGLGILSLLVLLMGAVQLIFPLVAGALLGVGLVLAGICYRAWWPLRAEAVARPADDSVWNRRLTWLGLLLIIGLSLLYSLLTHALLPPLDYDVVAYHLAIPRLYIEAHQLIYLPYILHSNWPLGTEMLFLLGLLFDAEAMAQLIVWVFTILLCAALVLFGERWLPPLTGWVSAAVLCSVPMVLTLAGIGMVEMPLACYTFLAFYAFWHWHTTAASGWLVLSALLAGAAAATKLNGAAVAILFGGLALGLLLRAGRPTQAVRTFVLYGLISFLVVLPWYVKAWYFAGNPIWPFLHPLLGGHNWDALGSTYLMGFLHATNMPLTPGNWLTGFWQVTVAEGQFGSFMLGYSVLGLLPLGVLAAVWRAELRPLLVLLGLIIVALYTVWFLLTHQTRFLMMMLPFAILFGAAGVAWLWARSTPPLRTVLQLALVGWLFAGTWLFDPYHQFIWERSQPYLQGQVDREAYLANVAQGYAAFQYANQQLPPDARVLLAPYESRGYYLNRSYLWANPIGQRTLRFEQMADVGDLLAELQRREVTHVLMNTGLVIDDIAHWKKIDGLLAELTAEHGQLLFQGQHTRVYVLDYARGES